MVKAGLKQAIVNGEIDKIQRSIAGASPLDESNALNYAIQNCSFKSARMLLKTDVKIPGDGMGKAIDSGSIEGVEMLIPEIQDINEIRLGSTALMVATKRGNLPIVNGLLQVPGINPNIAGTKNRTP